MKTRKKKLIVVSVSNDLVTDQRVDKVCTYLHNCGHDVLLVGRKLKSSLPLTERPYKTHRMHLLFTKGALFYAFFNLRLFFFLLRKKADVLLANDLDTLLANHWAKKFSSAELVYDSHEFFTEVPELVNRPKVQKIWEGIEKRILPRVKHLYTVNDSIAELYFKKYGLRFKVVRNISPLNELTAHLTRKDLQLPEDKKIIIVQGAGINIDRGNEELLQAMLHLPNAFLIIIGNGDVVPQLKQFVKDNHLNERVLFNPKMPYKEMMNYTRLADVGFTMDKDTNLNYKYSLPNKLFDFIHAGIPVFSSNLPELKKIIEHYRVGEICMSHDPIQMAQQLNSLLNDEPRLTGYKINTTKAREELNWQKECKILDEIYAFMNS